MKKPDENLIQKMFGSFALGTGKLVLRSNVYNNGGYSAIGQTSSSKFFENLDRKSPLLGNALPSNRLTSYYEKLSELKGYKNLDISSLCVSFFADYLINYLSDEANGQTVTILNEEGEVNEQVTERINNTLNNDIRIFDYIRDHIKDYVYYGGYYSMLQTTRDDTGHIRFRIEELADPISVVIKRRLSKETGKIEEVFIVRGVDGNIYEIPENEIIYLATSNLRLENDLSKDWKDNNKSKTQYKRPTEGGKGTRDKVLRQESYAASEPLFYTLSLKVKELVVKELLISLLSLRDLSSVQIFLLQFDKSIPLESANELCARATKLANSTNELASFISSTFDLTSFIENTLTQPAKFLPDYNSTLGGKNTMLPLDKLSDKLIELMQGLDQNKAAILGPLGLPATLIDSTSGSKWQVLQQSERANSRVASFMTSIKDSVTNLVKSIYKTIYEADINPSLIRLHICDKTSVEYNNQINQSESINSLMQGISTILQTSLQTLDMASPLIDSEAYLTYIHNLIKDIDPNTENLITKESTDLYLQLVQAKINSQFEQLGVEPPQTNTGNETN